jgi:hypothetical protein
MSTKMLANPEAVYTVDRGYLCRIDRGVLNYDYPSHVGLKVIHLPVYEQLVKLKNEHGLEHVITFIGEIGNDF